jgi:hypothetical protein
MSGTGLEVLVWLGFVTHQFSHDEIFSFRRVNVKNKSGSASSKGANGLSRFDRGEREIGAGRSYAGLMVHAIRCLPSGGGPASSLNPGADSGRRH